MIFILPSMSLIVLSFFFIVLFFIPLLCLISAVLFVSFPLCLFLLYTHVLLYHSPFFYPVVAYLLS
ncbi:MAG: hypothetical protein JOS17DRAFT_751578 [Linnemannia elongata]|nr:MAG: hypothetical protein JOS17DRAFT_751578 [Linnemannia elongata]